MGAVARTRLEQVDKPDLDEMGDQPSTTRARRLAPPPPPPPPSDRGKGEARQGPRKPDLEEMGPQRESKPYRDGRAALDHRNKPGQRGFERKAVSRVGV